MNYQSNGLSFNPKVQKLETQERRQRNYNHLKPAYQAMTWKNYAMMGPRKNSLDHIQRLSAKNSVRDHQSPSYHISQVPSSPRLQPSRLSTSKYNQSRISQNATLKRVQLLQQKVLPLLSQQNLPSGQYDQTWQLRMEQKLMKIQNSIQNYRNQMEVKYQKRIVQMERTWDEKINELINVYQLERTQLLQQDNRQPYQYDNKKTRQRYDNSRQRQQNGYYRKNSAQSNGYYQESQQSRENQPAQEQENLMNTNQTLQRQRVQTSYQAPINRYYRSGFDQQ